MSLWCKRDLNRALFFEGGEKGGTLSLLRNGMCVYHPYDREELGRDLGGRSRVLENRAKPLRTIKAQNAEEQYGLIVNMRGRPFLPWPSRWASPHLQQKACVGKDTCNTSVTPAAWRLGFGPARDGGFEKT